MKHSPFSCAQLPYPTSLNAYSRHVAIHLPGDPEPVDLRGIQPLNRYALEPRPTLTHKHCSFSNISVFRCLNFVIYFTGKDRFLPIPASQIGWKQNELNIR